MVLFKISNFEVYILNIIYYLPGTVCLWCNSGMTGTGVTTPNNFLLEFHRQKNMPGMVNLDKN